jgi:hypothetical protein
MLGQLGAERGLDHPAGQLGHQPARGGHLVGLETLERPLELLLGNSPTRRSGDLLRRPAASVLAARSARPGVRGLRGHREGVLSGPPAGTSQVGHPDLTQDMGQNPSR